MIHELDIGSWVVYLQSCDSHLCFLLGSETNLCGSVAPEGVFCSSKMVQAQGAEQKHGMLLKDLAQNCHLSHPLTFSGPKQVTWPSSASVGGRAVDICWKESKQVQRFGQSLPTTTPIPESGNPFCQVFGLDYFHKLSHSQLSAKRKSKQSWYC